MIWYDNRASIMLENSTMDDNIWRLFMITKTFKPCLINWVQVRLHGGQLCPEVFTGAFKEPKVPNMAKDKHVITSDIHTCYFIIWHPHISYFIFVERIFLKILRNQVNFLIVKTCGRIVQKKNETFCGISFCF